MVKISLISSEHLRIGDRVYDVEFSANGSIKSIFPTDIDGETCLIIEYNSGRMINKEMPFYHYQDNDPNCPIIYLEKI